MTQPHKTFWRWAFFVALRCLPAFAQWGARKAEHPSSLARVYAVQRIGQMRGYDMYFRTEHFRSLACAFVALAIGDNVLYDTFWRKADFTYASRPAFGRQPRQRKITSAMGRLG